VNSCVVGDDSWYLKSSTLDLNYATNIGVARNARLEFQGVPILYTPWIDFPLDGSRKSGLLTPTFRSGTTGFDIALLLEHRAQFRCHLHPAHQPQAGHHAGR
jgi:LPS-assembly protein